MNKLANTTVIALLSINLMGFGQAANADVVLLNEYRNVSASASVATPIGSDSESSSRNSLGDFSDFDELVAVDRALANGAASATAQQTSQISTTFISASGATTASVEVIAATDPLDFTFAAANADAGLSVDFEVTTPQLFNLSGAVSLFNPSPINGAIASVSLRSQDGSLIFSTDIFDYQPTPVTTPFDQSGMLPPDLYTLSAGTVIGASASFATLESGTAEFSFDFEVTTVPVPAAAWLFGSGILGMIGIARRSKAA